ncbi:uncharacterized protein LOC119319483 [Triticum dicoccoides]|uniref:uncharacterized protein LOC119319483 n=1 Tax=Triticum dicoccoides TaxID=85692 RepID=UPI001890DD5D|nr:uncharacterized protein LOC119319483 [Triticum dicoccoides]
MEMTSTKIALCCVLILSGATIRGCFCYKEENIKEKTQSIPWPLQIPPINRDEASTQASEEQINHFSVHLWNKRLDGNNYYALEATMDVYGFHLGHEEQSVAAIWIYSRGEDGKSPVTGFALGWHIHPALYKDTNTYFLTHWTGNGSPPDGCYNIRCPGYIRTSSSTTPGDVITPVSSIRDKKQYITIKAYKDKKSGDWQVHYGFNSPAKLIGYFPKSLFSDMEKKQLIISFGGFTSHPHAQPSPPMGSGLFPGRNAASFKNLKFVDAEGSTHDINKDLPFNVTSHSCYRLPTIVSGHFFYGGSGHCVV